MTRTLCALLAAALFRCGDSKSGQLEVARAEAEAARAAQHKAEIELAKAKAELEVAKANSDTARTEPLRDRVLRPGDSVEIDMEFLPRYGSAGLVASSLFALAELVKYSEARDGQGLTNLLDKHEVYWTKERKLQARLIKLDEQLGVAQVRLMSPVYESDNSKSDRLAESSRPKRQQEVYVVAKQVHKVSE